MPNDVLNKIKYLCKTIPRQEWSGILLYTIEGSIKQPKDMMITLKEIIVMDKGSAAATEYNFNEKKRDNSGYLDRHIDYTNEHEEAIFWKIGQIHSHHSMRVFFSDVDVSELNDNSASHNYYLSLIVNNYMDMIAKVAFRASVDTVVEANYTAIDDEGEPYVIQGSKFTVKKEKLYEYDCDIISNAEQITVPKEFADNVADVIKIADTPAPVKNQVVPAKNTVSSYPGSNQIPISQTTSKGVVNPNISKNQVDREIGFKQSSTNIAKNIIDEGFDNVEEELDLVEIFTMATFSGGNFNEEHLDLDHTLDEIEIFVGDDGIDANSISASFMELYVPTFQKYFGESADEEGKFEEVAQSVIELLEYYELTYEFLSKTIMSMKYMLNKFKTYGKSTV